MRYGSVPVVHSTGGLADTVIDLTPEGLLEGTSTGFVFLEYNTATLYDELERALKHYQNPIEWEALMKNGMRQDWSFIETAKNYIRVYNRIFDSE
jgi:starch synthase